MKQESYVQKISDDSVQHTRSLRIYENLHIPLWLLKDTCWVLEWRIPGMIMIVPTVLFALRIAWKTRKKRSEFLPNLAIVFWIIANASWMADEFYELGIKQYCIIPFVLGLLAIAWWLVADFPRILKEYRNQIT